MDSEPSPGGPSADGPESWFGDGFESELNTSTESKPQLTPQQRDISMSPRQWYGETFKTEIGIVRESATDSAIKDRDTGTAKTKLAEKCQEQRSGLQAVLQAEHEAEVQVLQEQMQV